MLLDPRGTGGSDRPADPRAYAIADYAADLEELREHLGLERMILLGHSHGGVVAMEYAATHPDRVERLILASTLPRWATEQEAAMQAAVEACAGRAVVRGREGDALEDEQAGRFAERRGAGRARLREIPLYFAATATTSAPTSARCAATPERGRAAALRPGDLRDVRHAPAAGEDRRCRRS